MTDKFYLKEVCGEYKFYEEGDAFPLTEKQILNKLNENEQLKNKLKFFMELNKPDGDIIKENEQLKNENAKMKKELSLLAEFNQKAIL